MTLTKPKLATCLWFENQADEAAEFYCSVFKTSRIGRTAYYPDAGQDVHGKPEKSVLTVEFELEGMPFTALNAGPLFKFNEAISLQVRCQTQEEIDGYRRALTAGGQDGRGGWLKDKYGLSWQIVRAPTSLGARRIVPCLWFDTQGEDAARFYCSVFKNSKLGGISRYSDAGKEVHGKEAGSVMVVEFELEGNPFITLNGGPQFKFNEAISIQVPCKTQEEIDYYWTALTADGGQESQCGWLKDKFGLSWQVFPDFMGDILAGPDRAAAARVMGAFMKMKKFDMAAIEKARASH
ncbi:MAG: VOC family protein [Proteobacteria bacterium]|nr:VOC family protein [Pseudomonadota bacterium]